MLGSRTHLAGAGLVSYLETPRLLVCELEPFLDRGIGMMLFTGILIAGILAVGSSYPGMIG